MIRRHILFGGRVQGVGFRYYSVQSARELGLTGWVRNLRDGTVEMEVQGEEEKLDLLLAELRQRRWIRIDSMEISLLPLKKERDFRERT